MSTTASSESTINNPTPSQKTRGNGKPATQNAKPRVISNPNDVASLVLMQVDAVNAKKDDLTIAIKGLADTAKQLTRAYAQQQQVIAKLAKRLEELENKK